MSHHHDPRPPKGRRRRRASCMGSYTQGEHEGYRCATPVHTPTDGSDPLCPTHADQRPPYEWQRRERARRRRIRAYRRRVDPGPPWDLLEGV